MTERNPREGIREELRQKIMEQLQECSRMEDDELYEQISPVDVASWVVHY